MLARFWDRELPNSLSYAVGPTIAKGDSAFSFHLLYVFLTHVIHGGWNLLRAESRFQNQLQSLQMQPATTCVFFSGKNKLIVTRPSAMCCLNLTTGVVTRCLLFIQILRHFTGELMSGYCRQWSHWLLKHLLLLEIAVAVGPARG